MLHTGTPLAAAEAALEPAGTGQVTVLGHPYPSYGFLRHGSSSAIRAMRERDASTGRADALRWSNKGRLGRTARLAGGCHPAIAPVADLSRLAGGQTAAYGGAEPGRGADVERAADRGQPVCHALQAGAGGGLRGVKAGAVVGDGELEVAIGAGQ